MKTNLFARVAAVTLVVALAIPVQLWAQQVRYNLIDLGPFHGGLQSYVNIPPNYAQVLNNNGVVAGWADTSKVDPYPSFCFNEDCQVSHAFQWQNGVTTDLGVLSGRVSSAAFWIAGNGLIAGVAENGKIDPLVTGFPELRAVLWTNGTMTNIPTLGGTFAMAECANNEGQVIGQSNLAGDLGCDGSATDGSCFQHAFLWDHGMLRDLGALDGGNFSLANWINNKGEIVGGATTSDAFHAALWRKGAITDLGTLPGDCASIAWAINSKSQIVGQSFNCDANNFRSVLWDKGSIIDLNVISVDPLDINEKGEIFGLEAPPGCPDTSLCAVQAFLLIPCASGQGCEGKDSISAQIETPAVATTLAQRREMTKAFVARLRSRPAKR